MYGALIGDIIGSKYEFHNIKTKDFPLFSRGCDYTDDSIMTVAVANAILRRQAGEGTSFHEMLIEEMQYWGRRYPNPSGAYGGNFSLWLVRDNPQPYNSFGNGSAMRASPCGLAAVTLEEAQALAWASAAVSHNHPEGIKGAVATASAVFLAKTGKSKPEIRAFIEEYFYPLNMTVSGLQKTYRFDASCQGTVPQAMVAFLESKNFEDAMRNVVAIGGDCDTLGAIAGSVAYTYYAVAEGGYSAWARGEVNPITRAMRTEAQRYLTAEFVNIAARFHEMCVGRAEALAGAELCPPILSPEESAALVQKTACWRPQER